MKCICRKGAWNPNCQVHPPTLPIGPVEERGGHAVISPDPDKERARRDRDLPSSVGAGAARNYERLNRSTGGATWV